MGEHLYAIRGENLPHRLRNAGLTGEATTSRVVCYSSGAFRVGLKPLVGYGPRAPRYVATVHRQRPRSNAYHTSNGYGGTLFFHEGVATRNTVH